MRIALVTSYKANKKEPLADVLGRVFDAFAAAGSVPLVQFVFADAPVPGTVACVERLVRRHPEFAPFATERPSMSAGPPVPVASNMVFPPETPAQFPFELLRAAAQGVPRSFPFHNVQFILSSPAFGDGGAPTGGMLAPGVHLGDSWWVNGRNRSVASCVVVDADEGAPAAPAILPAAAAVLSVLGKADKTQQVPLALLEPPTPDNLALVAQINAAVLGYRNRLDEVMARANLPHDLPPLQEAARVLGLKTGPRKPALAAAFAPLGYDCAAESGTFTLRRRTAANLSAEVFLDVGTWSSSLTGFFELKGPGFTARLRLPPSRRAGPGQYPLGDAARWKQICENLAALVAELDRSLVPEIEAISGPAPAWFRPAS